MDGYRSHREPSEPKWGNLSMRLQWVFGERYRCVGVAAITRAFWRRVIRGYVYEICGKCGRPVGLVWSAPDATWLEINGQKGGVRCIPCFNLALEATGVQVSWVPDIGRFCGPSGKLRDDHADVRGAEKAKRARR